MNLRVSAHNLSDFHHPWWWEVVRVSQKSILTSWHTITKCLAVLFFGCISLWPLFVQHLGYGLVGIAIAVHGHPFTTSEKCWDQKQVGRKFRWQREISFKKTYRLSDTRLFGCQDSALYAWNWWKLETMATGGIKDNKHDVSISSGTLRCSKKQKPGAFLVANTQTKKLSRIPTSSWIRHGFPNRASVKAASIWNVENAVSLSTPYQLI